MNYELRLLDDLFRLEGSDMASCFLLDPCSGFLSCEFVVLLCVEKRWVIIVWNSHDVVKTFPPESAI